jgi:hypothetical protein
MYLHCILSYCALSLSAACRVHLCGALERESELAIRVLRRAGLDDGAGVDRLGV